MAADSEEEMDMSYGSASDSEDDNGSDAFEAPPIVAQESSFHVLKPEDCLAQATKRVRSHWHQKIMHASCRPRGACLSARAADPGRL